MIYSQAIIRSGIVVQVISHSALLIATGVPVLVHRGWVGRGGNRNCERTFDGNRALQLKAGNFVAPVQEFPQVLDLDEIGASDAQLERMDMTSDDRRTILGDFTTLTINSHALLLGARITIGFLLGRVAIYRHGGRKIVRVPCVRIFTFTVPVLPLAFHSSSAPAHRIHVSLGSGSDHGVNI